MNVLKTIDTGSTLNIIALEEYDNNADVQNFINAQKNPKLKLAGASPQPDHALQYQHVQGFMRYLEVGYNNHKGVFITPEQIWLLVLSQISSIVNERPEDFRDLFTESEGKQEIMVEDEGDELISTQLIVDELNARVQFNSDILFPEIEEFDLNYEFCANASFAEMSSHYYNYSMYCCGFRFVTVLGVKQDWLNILTAILDISHEFMDEYLSKYLNQVYATISMYFASPDNVDAEDFTKMFYVERCGSGGQVEVHGWFRELYHFQPSIKYPENYSTGISKVKYKRLITGQSFELYTGLLGFVYNPEDDSIMPACQYILAEELQDTAEDDNDDDKAMALGEDGSVDWDNMLVSREVVTTDRRALDVKYTEQDEIEAQRTVEDNEWLIEHEDLIIPFDEDAIDSDISGNDIFYQGGAINKIMQSYINTLEALSDDDFKNQINGNWDIEAEPNNILAKFGLGGEGEILIATPRKEDTEESFNQLIENLNVQLNTDGTLKDEFQPWTTEIKNAEFAEEQQYGDVLECDMHMLYNLYTLIKTYEK